MVLKKGKLDYQYCSNRLRDDEKFLIEAYDYSKSIYSESQLYHREFSMEALPIKKGTIYSSNPCPLRRSTYPFLK